MIWAFPFGPRFTLILHRALATGRYPLQSLTQKVSSSNSGLFCWIKLLAYCSQNTRNSIEVNECTHPLRVVDH